MAQRYVIENPGQQAELRPIASPVDTFAPPIIQAPEMKNIIDLAPLSKSFTDLASSMAAGIGEETQKAAAAAYAEAGPELKEALSSKDPQVAREKLAALSRSKQIPEHYQPLFYKSLYMFGAKDAMGKYETALKAELDKFNTVTDENGNFMPDPQKSPEQVAQELWSSFSASNPVLANYDGRQEASKYLGNIQGNFIAAATETRAAALKQWRGEQIENDWGRSVLKLADSPTEAMEEIQQKLAEARELGMPDIQKKLTGSVIAAAASLKSRAVVSSNRLEQSKLFDQAADILTQASEIRLGKSSLGTNLATQADLDSALESLEQERDRADRKQFEDMSRSGLRDGVIAEVRQQNLPAADERDAVAAALEKKYGPASEGVLAGLENYDKLLKAETADVANDPEYERLITTALLQKDFDRAEQLVQTAYASKKLNNPLAYSNQINEGRSRQQAVTSTPTSRRTEQTIGSIVQDLRTITGKLPSSDKYTPEIGDMERELDDQLAKIMTNNALSADQKDAELQKLRETATKRAADYKDTLAKQQAEAEARLRKWAFNEEKIDDATRTALIGSIDRDVAQDIENLHKSYNEAPSWLVNPQNSEGAFTNYTAKVTSALNNAQLALQTTGKSPEVYRAGDIINRVIDSVKGEARRKAVKDGLNPVEQKAAVAAAVEKAVQETALPSIKEMLGSDVDTYKTIATSLLSPQAVAESAATGDYMVKANAGRKWNDHYMRTYNDVWRVTFVYDENDIPQEVVGSVNGLSEVGLNLQKYREDMAEVLASWPVATKNATQPKDQSQYRNGVAVLKDFKEYPQRFRDQFIAKQFDGWELKAYAMNDPTKATDLVTNAAQTFGVTTRELLEGRVSSRDETLGISGIRLDTTKLNPAYTPFFMDVPSKGTYDGVRSGLPTLREYFNRAQTDRTGTEGRMLASTLKKLNIPDTDENRDIFIRDQLTAHSRFFN